MFLLSLPSVITGIAFLLWQLLPAAAGEPSCLTPTIRTPDGDQVDIGAFSQVWHTRTGLCITHKNNRAVEGVDTGIYLFQRNNQVFLMPVAGTAVTVVRPSCKPIVIPRHPEFKLQNNDVIRTDNGMTLLFQWKEKEVSL